MTRSTNTKKALLVSALALVLCLAMLTGTTFAWFTDTETSSGNKIVAGNLDIDLELLEKDGSWTSIEESNKAIFDYDKWEPGYTDVKILRVVNNGNLALKWKAKFVSADAVGKLAEVLDVYVNTTVTEMPENRADIEGWTKAGTVKDFLDPAEGATMPNIDATNGTLLPQKEAYLGIAIKMQETAGNEYMGENLVGTDAKCVFDIQIIATQLEAEYDAFDNQYDKDATLDFAPVSSFAELKIALANKEANIVLTDNVEIEENLDVTSSTTINGAGFTVDRKDGYTGIMFTVKEDASLTLEDITLDGGAVWNGGVATLSTNSETVTLETRVNTGVNATGSLVATEGNANLILNEDTILMNNDGASAVSLATRGGGTLTVNGAYIINNTSAGGGAIWGGGNIIINEGSKINYNHATSIGGAVRMVNGNNNITFTMNGGEMNYNTSAGNGGAIWGGNNANYFFNGGEMAYNSANAGGAIWTGTYESYTITGNFEMHDNSATELGGAIRFCNYAKLTMTGGKIYGNKQGGESNAFYANNNTCSITGGKISDNFSYAGGLGFTLGEADIEGVVAFSLSTNHNTAYLANTFNEIKFTVNEEDEHFSNFNFKPAEGYVYTAGDEAKLICLNEGYSTYWDTATGTFRLQAITE